jgi:hypothetical protein
MRCFIQFATGNNPQGVRNRPVPYHGRACGTFSIADLLKDRGGDQETRPDDDWNQEGSECLGERRKIPELCEGSIRIASEARTGQSDTGYP